MHVSFFSLQIVTSPWSAILFFLLLMLLKEKEEKKHLKKRWEFDWIFMMNEKKTLLKSHFKIICVREKCLKFKRVKKCDKITINFVICGKVSNGNDHMIYYTLKVFIAVDFICSVCYSLFFGFVRSIFFSLHLTCSKWHEILEGFTVAFTYSLIFFFFNLLLLFALSVEDLSSSIPH